VDALHQSHENELFGETRMQASLQQLHAAKKEQSWRPRIDELFE